MLNEFFTAFSLSMAAMFPIINPIGHAPMFYAMTKDDSPNFRRQMATKTALYTFLILLISLLAGDYILEFFGVTLDDLRIAGGIMIAHAAWGMLNNNSRVTVAEHSAAVDKEDVSLTPMATPILSGPGAISLAIGLISYGHTVTAYTGYIAGFFAIGLITLISMRYADQLVKIVSPNGIGALNRILGFFILAIGVNLIVDGIKNIFINHT